MRRLFGISDSGGRAGANGHKALRSMVMESGKLAAGQDSLRAELSSPHADGHAPSYARQEVPHSHSRIAGSVASTPRKK